MFDKAKFAVGNLTAPRINTAASKANLRASRNGSSMNISVPPVMGKNQADFEAAMAASRSQNNILEKVLQGPVSQQTQRQLAKLKESNARDKLAAELNEANRPQLAEAVKSNGLKLASSEAENQNAASQNNISQNNISQDTTSQNATNQNAASQNAVSQNAVSEVTLPKRRTMGLTAGPTIASGLETGKRFTPSQM
ncbi:MAG: hypothetical protein LBE31_10520, partial [Deltaproteobacteria bacterium]|nr:hypothetical protein [Deltaproteobacteria bacterium]